jgi:proline iminopeptidase
MWLVVLIWASSAGRAATAEDRPTEALKSGEFTVELNDMKLWYKVSGSGPVCFMPTPAWGPSSDLYFRTLKSMEKLLTVVYIDSRGTGRSGRAKTAKEYTWDHLVTDLDALRVHLKQDTVWLMGRSEGGEQVPHYTCKHPGRVSGMVLMNTVAVSDEQQWADAAERSSRRKGQPWYDDAMKARQLKPQTDEEMTRQLKSLLPLYWSDPKKAEPFMDDFAATTFSAAALAGLAESKRFPFDVTAQLKDLTVPTLIVVGDDDFICSPEYATRMHLALRNSKRLVIEKRGHFPWLEQPKVFQTRVPEFRTALGLPAR